MNASRNNSSDWEELFEKHDVSALPWFSPRLPCAPPLDTLKDNDAVKEGNKLSDEPMTNLSSSPVASSPVLKALKPLCMCVNQTYTRVGVGHESGFLVFKVKQDTAENHDDVVNGNERENRNANQPQRAKAPSRTLSHLVVDPTYNSDSHTFSTIRRRAQSHMRAAATALNPITAVSQQQRDANQTRASFSRSGALSFPQEKDLSEATKTIEGDTRSPQISTTTGNIGLPRIYVQGAGGQDEGANTPSLRDSKLVNPYKTDEGGGAIPIKIAEDSHSLNLFLSYANLNPSCCRIFSSDADVSSGSPCEGEHPPYEGAPLLTPTYSPSVKHTTESLALSDILKATSDDIVAETLLNSELHRAHGSLLSPHFTLNPAVSSVFNQENMKRRKNGEEEESVPSQCVRLLWNDDDDEEDEEKDTPFATHFTSKRSRLRQVGFCSGGVGLMALLYEQPRVAVVGGGSMPIGNPKEILLIGGGEVFNIISEPHPVRQLFLDARVLISMTSQEVRFYSNPMERQWTACQYVLPLLDPTRRSPSGLPGVEASPGSSGVPVKCFSRSDDATAQNGSGRKSAEDTALNSPPHRVPFVINYARNLLLTCAMEGWSGFMLLHFSTSPQVNAPYARRGTHAVEPTPGSTNLLCSPHSVEGGGRCATTLENTQEGGPSAIDKTFRIAMPTAIRVKVMAVSPPGAHRNPLDQLAMYVGCTSFSGRLQPLKKTAVGSAAAAAASTSSDEVTLVAACSVYATRITLWVLTPISESSARPSSISTDGGEGTCAGEGTHCCAVKYTFSQIRVFRVGFRIPLDSFSMWRYPRPYETSTNTLYRRNSDSCRLGKDSARSNTDPADEVGLVGSHRIHQLQFLCHGQFVFCIRNGSMLVFSTTEEDPSEKKLSGDHLQAAVNHRSIFSNAVRLVVPGGFRIFHDYAQQEWFSCRASLPLRDPVFYPQWLWMYKQDLLADWEGRRQSSQRCPRLEDGNGGNDKGDPDMPDAQQKHSAAQATSPSSRLGRWVSQLALMTGRFGAKKPPGKNSMTRNDPLNSTVDTWGNRATTLGLPVDESSSFGDKKGQKVVPPDQSNPMLSRHQPCSRSFTQIGPCILVWEHDLVRGTANAHRFGPANAPLGLQSLSQAASPFARCAYLVNTNKTTMTCKVVLDCVTCDGAFLNIRLYTKEGTLRCSPALPCTLE